MPTIQATVTRRELLNAVGELPLPELNSFVGEVLQLRAQRVAPPLPETEAALLDQISQGVLSEADHRRYHELRKKLQAETLTTEERAELLQLSDEAERRNADRVQALVELAQLRGRTLDSLMDELGIRPCSHG